jgi:hypothetical protein
MSKINSIQIYKLNYANKVSKIIKLNVILNTEKGEKYYNLLCVSIYLALSFLPPKRAAAAFLKKFFAGLDKWKSGTVWQQLEESLSGVKPCRVSEKTFSNLLSN